MPIEARLGMSKLLGRGQSRWASAPDTYCWASARAVVCPRSAPTPAAAACCIRSLARVVLWAILACISLVSSEGRAVSGLASRAALEVYKSSSSGSAGGLPLAGRALAESLWAGRLQPSVSLLYITRLLLALAEIPAPSHAGPLLRRRCNQQRR